MKSINEYLINKSTKEFRDDTPIKYSEFCQKLKDKGFLVMIGTSRVSVIRREDMGKGMDNIRKLFLGYLHHVRGEHKITVIDLFDVVYDEGKGGYSTHPTITDNDEEDALYYKQVGKHEWELQYNTNNIYHIEKIMNIF